MSNEQKYLDLMHEVYAEGEWRSDRTGTGVSSLFGKQVVYDLADGFPLLTTKKIHWKSVVHELLWFLKGDTNIKYLQDNGVHIWDHWRRPYNLDRDIEIIEPRKAVPALYSGNFSRAKINTKPDTIERDLAIIWHRMMHKCYDPTHTRYAYYGAVGVTVHPDWHDVEAFIKGVQKIPHWWYRANNPKGFDLDKDYYGANQYGPNTSVWLKAEENHIYTRTVKPILVRDLTGTTRLYLSQAEAARRTGMSKSALNRVMKYGTPRPYGANRRFEGWEFNVAEFCGLLPRLKLIEDGDLGPIYSAQYRNLRTVDGKIVDQIQNLINGIKADPYGRRHIVSAWNPSDLHNMALPPCHAFYQIYVHTDGTMDLQLMQRSADAYIGIPYNIASYSLLLMMIAQVTGYRAGRFIHTMGDVHLYRNHVDAYFIQKDRTILPPPTVTLNAEIKGIFDFKFEDITLENYNPHPAIKAPVAV